LGPCTIKRRAFGKHGFCSPKIFIVSAPGMPVRCYRFVDKAIATLDAAPPHNDTLCRIAIAQFMATLDLPAEPEVAELDVTQVPYAGEVYAANGKRLRGALVQSVSVPESTV
jgi:hypothetical protein